MTWEEYYEKMNDWATSTAVNKISSLTDMGAPNEIVEALNNIALEDEKGATKLLNRAVQYGIKFSGENLAEIAELCSEESFRNALYQSAPTFSARDLEALYGFIDDELIVDVAKRFRISPPADIADEYEEELCSDTRVPISWNRFYNAYVEWQPEYARARLQSVTNYGNGDEILEVVQELFGDDEDGASRFVTRALDGGVRFKDESLAELSEYCNENTVNRAILLSGPLMTKKSLEKLYGYVSDDILIQVAKKQNIQLPEELREEEEDINDAIYSAIDAADYALECLAQALQALNDSSNVSFIDMTSKGFFTSLWKHATLSGADVDIRQAQNALQNLNAELRIVLNNQSVQLKCGRLATTADLWLDDGMLDAVTHLQINQAQKRMRKAITQVESIRRELQRLL